MPSPLHEMLVELVRNCPSLVPELLAAVFGVPVPGHRIVALEPGDLTDLIPTEYRADIVVVLRDDGGKPVHASVVEVQLRPDERKRLSWPVYVATMRARLACPTDLLVFCTDLRTARWCAVPIHTGLGASVMVPLVLGPDRIPIVTDAAAAAREPELAVLSAIAHGAEPGGITVLEALISGLVGVDETRSALYYDLIMTVLPAAARSHLEALMSTRTWEYQSDFVRKHIFQGRAEAKVEGILTVLDARGIAVPEAARARIDGCRDLAQLDVWLRRAVTIESVDDLLA